MKISSIIDIVDGELKNSPSISFVYNIKTNAKKILEGDLFIAKYPKDIEEAINNGAFAIIYDDSDTNLIDNEIAWIKVKSTQESLKKLFRFKLSHLDLRVYYCDKVSFELLNIYKNTDKNIKMLSNKIDNSIKIIENIKPTDIIFCSNKELLNDIYPKYKVFNHNNYEIKNLIEHSLFETSFSYNGIFFSKLKIASLYINQFLDVYNFINGDIDLKKLIKLQSFKPIFIDKFINLIEFGKSSKFIITQKDFELVKNEILYIDKKFKYGKTIYITSKFIPNFDKEQFVFSKIKRIKEFLKNKEFNAVYLIGFHNTKIEKFLELSSIKKVNLF